jgi:hypothetical protein
VPIATNELLHRDRAALEISGRIAGEADYLITVPPGALLPLCDTLDALTSWTAYLDSGTPLVVRAERSGTVRNIALRGAAAGVIIAPKAVPAAALTEALGQLLPPDGSQDLIVLTSPDGGPIFWPLLFVDALDLIDPDAAAQLRASRI